MGRGAVVQGRIAHVDNRFSGAAGGLKDVLFWVGLGCVGEAKLNLWSLQGRGFRGGEVVEMETMMAAGRMAPM